MKILLTALLLSLLTSSGSIYDFTIDAADGTQLNLEDYRGKKILLVNIASQSPNVEQLAELELLQQQLLDSLIVIVYPSNSFGNEPLGNREIIDLCRNEYQVSFPIAAKCLIKGPGIDPVYAWLTEDMEDGTKKSSILGDFQKYLFDSNGKLLAIFSSNVSPLDTNLISTINQ